LYFDKVIQPGQAGAIIVRLHTEYLLGPVKRGYALQTNDPKHPVVSVTVVANVKPAPDYVKRIATANVKSGETNGDFQIWPTARPKITLEPGERLDVSLRIRPLAPGARSLKLAAGAPQSWKLRRETDGEGYWLDIPIEPAKDTNSQTVPLIVEPKEGPAREILVQLSVNVPSENVAATPQQIDFGEMALLSLSNPMKRLGIRKQIGSFHIKKLASTLPFLKLEQATMVEGSNYMIKITIDRTTPLKAGEYQGNVIIETDDTHAVRVEVPVKIKITER
jgi:hypothetical protein